MGKNTIKFEDKVLEKSDICREDTKLFKIVDIDLNEIKVYIYKKIIVKKDHVNIIYDIKIIMKLYL